MEYLHTEKFPKLYYRSIGTGPVIMLVHGFPENGDLWGKVVPRLAEKFRVIVPDLPGSGNSSFTGGLSIEDMAMALNLIAEKEQVGRMVLAGHSMGGYAALAFAELYPHKLAGLSMVHSIASADTEEKKETRRKAIDLIRKGGKTAFVRQMIPNLFAKAFKEKNPDIINQQVERGVMLTEESMTTFYTAMINRPDRSSILNKLGKPVQWIIGEEDTVAPPEKAAEQSSLSDVCFVSLYKDSAHMSMIENDEKLADDLMIFTQYCFSNS